MMDFTTTSNLILILLLTLFLILLFSWGIGSLARTASKFTGWDSKRAFWISLATYGILMTVLSMISFFVIITESFFAWVGPYFDWFVAWFPRLMIIGAVSPILNLILKLIFSISSAKTASTTSNESDINHIFISYRRSDSIDITGRLYDRLIDDFGKETVFKDVDSIPLGLNFKEYLNEQVGKCGVLLAVIGDHWLDVSDASGNRRLEDPSDFVRIEIESALERNIPVIPLLVRGASMPSEESLPSSLRKLVFMNGIPIRPDPDFHRDMDRLIKALEEYV